VWAKPLKFSISFGLNGATTLWLVRRLRPTRLTPMAAKATVIALAAEQALITMQAIRGVRSHFNNTTSLDSAIYSTMGALILVAWFAAFALAVGALRRPLDDALTQRVVSAGIWLVVAGSSVGFLMVAANKHSVGGLDGANHLPILGWNRAIGDLRPAHFVGLHALQTLIAISVILRKQHRPQRQSLRVITTASVAIGSLCATLALQASTGRPVTSASTLIVAAVSITTATIAWIATQAPRPS
jgi:hypothetical protein